MFLQHVHNRGELDVFYTIVGPKQTRPNDFSKSLKNIKFKEAVVLFFSEFWTNDSVAEILGEKTVFLTLEEKCFSYHAQGGGVIKSEVPELLCFHEEADTRMIFHVSKLKPNSRIMLKATDTDVLILLLSHMQDFPTLKIWMAGTIKRKEDQECVDCNTLAETLGPLLCSALPGFHAFTGCDYTAAFYRKGKTRPFNILEKNESFQRVFASLTDLSDIDDHEKVEKLQEFTSLMYTIKNCSNVNTARSIIFHKTYTSKKNNENLIKKIRGFDSTNIPPCFESLKQKILRTIFVTAMWKNATNQECITLRPEQCGWLMRDILEPIWFEGNPTPLSVEDILKNDPSDDTDAESDDFNNSGSSSSDSE